MHRAAAALRAVAPRVATRVARDARAPSRAAHRVAPASSSAANASTRSWEFRLLYDGACPLCVREVEMLRAKDDGRGKLDLVDIASDDYDAKENAGIEYAEAMKTIHGLDAANNVYTGVEVFEKAYKAVGLGYVYAFTKVPFLLNAANKVYDVWAKYRLNVTSRGSLAEHLAARKARMDGKNCDACEIDFETDGSQCDDGTLYLCETDEEEAKTASK